MVRSTWHIGQGLSRQAVNESFKKIDQFFSVLPKHILGSKIVGQQSQNKTFLA